MAAGLGFKTFTTGEVLTAANVNGYLMQGVLVFASTAARDAAITSPQEGQFAYTKDTNGLWYYDGAVWVASGATGDIEGVTAGTGISGGGTSGTVTITNSMATAIDAKGDLVAGTGADAFSRLAVGANDTVLTAASGETTGLKWAAPAQTYPTTAQDFVGNEQDTTSTSYTDLATSGPAVTVTTGTKALVIVTAMCRNAIVGAAASRAYMSYAVSGASTVAASDETAIKIGSGSTTPSLDCRFSAASLVTLTAGSNTFTAKYRVTADTGRWKDRTIFVMNLA